MADFIGIRKCAPKEENEDETGYVIDTPVVGYEKKFFGRENELKDLINSLLKGDHAMIIGSQRTGKSSLVEELKNEGARLFKDKADKFNKMLFIEIDFQGVGKAATRDEFEKRFRDGIIKSIESEYVGRGQAAPREFTSNLTNVKFNADLSKFLRVYLYPFVWKHYGFDKVVLTVPLL